MDGWMDASIYLYLPVHLPIYLPIYLSTHIYPYLSTHLPLFIHVYLCVSIFNYIYLYLIYPKCSMYGIFTYIYPKNGPNVGASGYNTTTIWHLVAKGYIPIEQCSKPCVVPKHAGYSLLTRWCLPSYVSWFINIYKPHVPHDYYRYI